MFCAVKQNVKLLPVLLAKKLILWFLKAGLLLTKAASTYTYNQVSAFNIQIAYDYIGQPPDLIGAFQPKVMVVCVALTKLAMPSPVGLTQIMNEAASDGSLAPLKLSA